MFLKYNEYPKLKTAQDKLKELQESQQALEIALQTAKADVTKQQGEVNEQDALLLIGDGVAGAADKAKKSLQDAKQRVEDWTSELAANKRAQEILGAKIKDIEAEAIQWAIDQVHPSYKKAAAKMLKAFQALQEANAELRTFQKAAMDIFPRRGNPHNAPYPIAAGIPLLALDMFEDQDSPGGAFHSDSQFKQWKAAAEEYLQQ